MTKRAGNRKELRVRDWLRDRDWFVVKAGGSLGAADLLACRAGDRPRLVEVKATAVGPYEHFGPRERARLSFFAAMAGADAYLAWWPPRGELHWIHETEWPQAKEA